VIPLQTGRSLAAASRAADRPSDPQVPVDRGAGPVDLLPANGPASAELEAMLEPMLGAIVRMAGADAGIVRVIDADGSCYEPVVATGIPGVAGDHGAHALAAWCDTCAESRDTGSACVQSNLCGHDERMTADVFGPVCKHIVAVPLRHKDRPVGTLGLMFEIERTLPAAMTPLLQATGDLLGMTLDNARLARLRVARDPVSTEPHELGVREPEGLAQLVQDEG
jgi:two-component system nitrate/nitrite sensor histidine kinase NarX